MGKRNDKANIMGMFDNQIVEFYDSSALVAKPLLQEKPQKLTLHPKQRPIIKYP